MNLVPVPGFCVKSSAHGTKVFVNIAWDSNVPAPSDDDPASVPVVVSDARSDTDKAGKHALVFDCIYNKSLKSRTRTDPEFKLFLVELALQRIEAQTSLVLSRHIATPNIASKGTLLPRTVSFPAPSWSWSKAGPEIQISISVPNLPRAVIEHATLDIEPRRFILRVPHSFLLDVNLGLPDAHLVPTQSLALKRQRPLDVQRATCEWRVADNMLIILA